MLAWDTDQLREGVRKAGEVVREATAACCMQPRKDRATLFNSGCAHSETRVPASRRAQHTAYSNYSSPGGRTYLVTK